MYEIPEIGDPASLDVLYQGREDTDAILIRALCHHLNVERMNSRSMTRELESLKRAIREAHFETREVKYERGPFTRMEFVTQLIAVDD